MKLSIILPVHNEEKNLAPLLQEISEALPNTNDYEIIAIDDGSTDDSWRVLKMLQGKYSHLRLISFRRNFGQSAAFDAGFRTAKGEFVVTMDSDRQNDPRDIPRMMQILEQGYDFVSGWRKKRDDNVIFRKIPSKIANWIIRKVTGTKLHDMGCSLKAFRREIIRELKLYGETHRFLAVYAEETGARTTEFIVNHRPRVEGTSKYGLNRTFKVILDLISVRFFQSFHTKPIYLFGGVGVALCAVGTLLMGYVAYEKLFLSIWVHKNPLFLLSFFSYIMGAQSFGLGLITEFIMRTYYESQNKRAYLIAETFDTSQDQTERADTVSHLKKRKSNAA